MSIKDRVKNIGRVGKSLTISFASQATTSVVSFVVVPLLIQHLTKPTYGLWVTLTSLVSWIFVSDFGIGYGFRNRVTEYLADGDRNKLLGYFKTTFQYYLILTGIILVLFTYQLFYNPILSEHKQISLILYLPYIVYFPFSISNQILQGLRLVHYNSLVSLFRALLWAAFIILVVTTNLFESEHLIYVAIGYSAINALANAALVYTAFTKSQLRIPSIGELWHKPVIDSTLVTGAKFFVLQISTLLLFSMGNYYVYSNLTPTDTAHYDTINKVYTLYMTFFNMIISVYWSEIAYHKASNDMPKLQEIYRKLLGVSLLTVLGAIFVMFAAPIAIPIWTNHAIEVTTRDCVPFSILISLQAFAYSGAVFLNAFEKVTAQLILAAINIISIHPLVKLGFHLNLGLETVPLAAAVLTIPSLIVCHMKATSLIKLKHRYSS